MRTISRFLSSPREIVALSEENKLFDTLCPEFNELLNKQQVHVSLESQFISITGYTDMPYTYTYNTFLIHMRKHNTMQKKSSTTEVTCASACVTFPTLMMISSFGVSTPRD